MPCSEKKLGSTGTMASAQALIALNVKKPT